MEGRRRQRRCEAIVAEIEVFAGERKTMDLPSGVSHDLIVSPSEE